MFLLLAVLFIAGLLVYPLRRGLLRLSQRSLALKYLFFGGVVLAGLCLVSVALVLLLFVGVGYFQNPNAQFPWGVFAVLTTPIAGAVMGCFIGRALRRRAAATGS